MTEKIRNKSIRHLRYNIAAPEEDAKVSFDDELIDAKTSSNTKPQQSHSIRQRNLNSCLPSDDFKEVVK